MATGVTTINGVQIYALSTGKAIPQWLSAVKRKQLTKSDPNFAKRVELLQDFSFPEASHCVRISGDGRYIIATGTYPPRVRVWDTAELSMKFERFMDSAPLATCSLSEDFSKMAFLQEDRNIEVHARYGRHYRTRIPVAGRDMAWHPPTAELLIATSSPEVYRLSLEEGRYLAPLKLAAPAANKVAVSSITALIAVACEGGTVEVWDPRGPSRAATLTLSEASRAAKPAFGSMAGFSATAVAWEEGGLGLAVGTSDARALVFDLRRTVPLSTKVHPYGLPVQTVAFHRGSGVSSGGRPGEGGASGGLSGMGSKIVLSSDSKQIKLWGRDDGKTFTNIEGNAPLGDVTLVSDSPWPGGSDSGLIFAASEQERVQAYYVPALGLAPRWAAFLDSLTEELAEGPGSAGMGDATAAAPALYDDFKFVDAAELGSLGLAHLIGTPLLKSYMHGYFMDARLYARVRAVTDPDSYERGRKERVAAAVAASRSSRVAPEDALPVVNAELARKLRGVARRAAAAAEGAAAGGEEEEGAGAGAGRTKPPPLLADARFARLFSDPSFAIDAKEAEVVALRRGGTAPNSRSKKRGRDRDSDEES
jgi:ribosome biogenesis protein ENP2